MQANKCRRLELRMRKGKERKLLGFRRKTLKHYVNPATNRPDSVEAHSLTNCSPRYHTTQAPPDLLSLCPLVIRLIISDRHGYGPRVSGGTSKLYGDKNLYPHETRTREVGMRVPSAGRLKYKLGLRSQLLYSHHHPRSHTRLLPQLTITTTSGLRAVQCLQHAEDGPEARDGEGGQCDVEEVPGTWLPIILGTPTYIPSLQLSLDRITRSCVRALELEGVYPCPQLAANGEHIPDDRLILC